MRISDWSSDVCSSDLVERLDHPPAVELGAPQQRGHQGDAIAALHRARLLKLAVEHDPATRRRRDVDPGLGEPAGPPAVRSEERRAGKEWVRPCRYRWSADH